MILALYILLALVVTGVVLRLADRRHTADDGSPEAPDDAGTPAPAASDADTPAESECCGMHITCERDSLLTALADKIEYYDDEELDAYAGRRPDQYSDAEIEQFRDVLLTLRPEEIAGWARSVQLRGIELPEPVRDELLLIVSEARAGLTAGHTHDV